VVWQRTQTTVQANVIWCDQVGLIQARLPDKAEGSGLREELALVVARSVPKSDLLLAHGGLLGVIVT
jgi:hypothetical protein